MDSCHGAASWHATAPPGLHGGGRNIGSDADTASARKAPMRGVAAEVPPKLVSVVAALASGMCSCVVRYVSMFVENPTTASFSATSPPFFLAAVFLVVSSMAMAMAAASACCGGEAPRSFTVLHSHKRV
nr:unnamed protein product [Digitaria exilis]